MPDSVAYVELADALERRLVGLQAGDRLPSENDLVRDAAVSRITARAALRELESRQLVRRTRGSGTFVALRLPYPIDGRSRPSFSSIVAAAGHEPEHAIEAVERRRAEADLAKQLGLRTGSAVMRLRRAGLVDGQVVAFQEHWLPSSVVPDLDRHVTSGSFTQLLVDRYGIETERWTSRVDLAPPPVDVAERLELVGRPPAWRLESLNGEVGGGRPVEYGRSWMRADAFDVTLHFNRESD